MLGVSFGVQPGSRLASGAGAIHERVVHAPGVSLDQRR
jgi:hypothetical protein